MEGRGGLCVDCQGRDNCSGWIRFYRKSDVATSGPRRNIFHQLARSPISITLTQSKKKTPPGASLEPFSVDLTKEFFAARTPWSSDLAPRDEGGGLPFRSTGRVTPAERRGDGVYKLPPCLIARAAARTRPRRPRPASRGQGK